MSKLINNDYKFEDFDDLTKLGGFVGDKINSCKKSKYNKGFVATADTTNFYVIKIAISKNTSDDKKNEE